MSIFIGPEFLIVLVALELLVIKFFLKKPIPWAEITMNLNSGQILLWLGRGLEVLGYYYIVGLIPYELTGYMNIGWVALIAFVLWDHQFYWLHNFHHKIPILWKIHEVHHQGEHFNSSLGIRNSWFSSLSSLPFFIPMALVGIPVEIFVLVSSIHYFIQFYNHNDVIDHPKWMESILITPSLHKVHHGINSEYHNKNCGGTFSIWDRIYGTHQQELKEVPVKLGLMRPFSSGSPISINLLPFTKKKRPKAQLNNNPILNIGSFLLYVQLLGFIAVQQEVSLIQGIVFVTFIFLGTLIIGFIQEGQRGGRFLWLFNIISFGVIIFTLEMFALKPIQWSMISTLIYTVFFIASVPEKSKNHLNG